MVKVKDIPGLLINPKDITISGYSQEFINGYKAGIEELISDLREKSIDIDIEKLAKVIAQIADKTWKTHHRNIHEVDHEYLVEELRVSLKDFLICKE